MSAACPVCDRETCRRDALLGAIDAEIREAAARGWTLDDDNPSLVAYRAALHACNTHRHDWRSEALTLRAEVVERRAIDTAADAFVDALLAAWPAEDGPVPTEPMDAARYGLRRHLHRLRAELAALTEDRDDAREAVAVLKRQAVRQDAELAALKARPLTVASALALPEVQSGACVVERRRVLHLSDGRALCFYDQYKITDRCLLMRGDDEDTDDGSHWTVWERVPVGPDPWLIAMPARLVPLADADLDPATRGEMP